MAQHFQDAGSECRPARGRIVGGKGGRPRPDDQGHREPDDSRRDERQVESNSGDEIPSQRGAQSLPGTLRCGIGAKPGAPLRDRGQIGHGGVGHRTKYGRGAPMQDPEHDESGERRDPEVRKRHEREHQGAGHEQGSTSQDVGQSTCRHLHEDARQRRRADDDTDRRRSRAEVVGEQRKQWGAADGVAAIRHECGRTQADQALSVGRQPLPSRLH